MLRLHLTAEPELLEAVGGGGGGDELSTAAGTGIVEAEVEPDELAGL